MQNFVTFETAKALKDAGFPQPEPSRGQMWWDEDDDVEKGESILITGVWEEGPYGENDFKDKYSPHEMYFSQMYFAPTASDIQNAEPFLRLRHDGEHWEAIENDRENTYYQIDNPAEACAAAWLSAHQPIAA